MNMILKLRRKLDQRRFEREIAECEARWRDDDLLPPAWRTIPLNLVTVVYLDDQIVND